MKFVGVDIGGTFTDLVVSDAGKLQIHKLLSTPHNPAEAMLAGLTAVGVTGQARISHGSTVATNAILERKGARTALITTQGFRDVLEIGRQNRPVLYALYPQIPPPLIPRAWRYEVPERLDYTGQVLTPLDIKTLDKVLDQIAEQQIESVAVCFLYSFHNPTHEQQVRQRIVERGILQEWQVSLSCEVLPEFREYERTSTVTLDAYVRPVMSRYLQHLEDKLPAQSSLLVMKSDGGVISARTARQQAAQTTLSGPAAGVIGAFHVAKLAGYDHIITLDMGGTSTDVALCPGAPSRRAETEIDGLPLRIRLLDIETVGTGGGSIARLDMGGALRVGPESAGASPGPVIYGRGGQQLTVSDANAVLGRLDANHFLGGQMRLELSIADSMMGTLAKQMKVSRQAAALGIVEIANVTIDRAVRRVSIARGHDPRSFTLMAFGGAGPLHACEVAERLQIPRVLVPRYPGVLCALGLLVADVIRDYSRAVLQTVTDETLQQMKNILGELILQAQHDLS
ncbi:MAG: hydantoinase/oxoprolinase family protein, partial [Anaerolineae bacterium]|nr:hydantoinase/oxoprolinase family protein [Anaerolineae bacterium]